jgi:hypothetical protein
MKNVFLFIALILGVSLQAQRTDIYRLRPAPTEAGQVITSTIVNGQYRWSVGVAQDVTGVSEYAAFFQLLNDSTFIVDEVLNTTGIDFGWTIIDSGLVVSNSDLHLEGNVLLGRENGASVAACDLHVNDRITYLYYGSNDEVVIKNVKITTGAKDPQTALFLVKFGVIRN